MTKQASTQKSESTFWFRMSYPKIFLAILSAVLVTCTEREDERSVDPVADGRFQLTIPNTFTLTDPIPEGDQWLKTFREGNGYKPEWETWVWRLTDIDVAPGIKVYARDSDERQFFVTGCDKFELLSVDFQVSEVGETGFYSGEHNVKLSPSGNYIVCLAENPRAFLHGLPIDDEVKRGGDWVMRFEGDTAIWHPAGR